MSAPTRFARRAGFSHASHCEVVMHARYFWTNLTLGFACLFFWREVPELRKPLPERPEQDGTYTAWWQWLIGVRPRHWRRFILAPVFSALVHVFGIHIVFGMGVKVRRALP